MKKKVLIVQPILAHYRRSLFATLAASEEFDIYIIAGKQHGDIKSIADESSKVSANLINKKLQLKGHSFIWQKGAVSYAVKHKPDIIVLTGVDPHLISNLCLALVGKLFLGSAIVWWGHASTKQQGRAGEWFRKFFFNLAKGAFTYSEMGKSNLQALLKPAITISVIRNCINTEEYGFNNPVKKNEQPILTILFSGRITREKRLDVLIDAMAVLKKRGGAAKCLVIGNGPEKAAAEKQSLTNGLDDVINFLGEQYGDACIPYFEAAHIFVLPGKVGLSIIHGLSYGLPVITTNKKEVHSPEFEIIRPGVNGDFFDEFNPESLAEKILAWRDRLSNNRKAVADNCVQSILDDGYTPEEMSNKMLDLFKKLSGE